MIFNAISYKGNVIKALIIYDQVPTQVAKMPRIGENMEQLKLIITAGERE